MNLVPVTRPPPVVSLEEAKRHLRVEDGSQDPLIVALVAAATGNLDGRDGLLGRALGRQAWDLVLSGLECWPRCSRGGFWFSDAWSGWGLNLPLPPLVSIEGVSYRDAAGALQIMDPSDYVVLGVGGKGSLRLAGGVAWPDVQASATDALTVRFVAGYPDGVPAPIKAAILLMVGNLFAHRGDGAPQAGTDAAAQALLAPYREYWS